MKKEYTVLGAWCLGFYQSLELLYVDFDSNKVLTKFTDERKVWSKIRTTKNGRQYICRFGFKYYFDECMAIMG